MRGMKVLSLFDGMACGMLAMIKQGIDVERYVAYEIDKYAIKTASHNFPMIEQRGDVFEADFTEFKGFDYLVGGSPCTYWSIAQKNNRETEASGMGWELFSQYVRALKEAEPKYFIYENNKSMSKAIRESITNTFGFEPILINSALVSAQNRQRLYWVGKRNEDGTYSKVDVEQPKDRGIVLRDILESGENLSPNEKSYALTTRCYGAIPEDTLTRSRHTMVAEHITPPVGVGYRNRREMDGKLYRRFETHNEEKSNALTTVQTDSMVAEPICLNSKSGRGGVEGLQPSLQDRIYSIQGKHTAVTTAFMPNIAEPIRIGDIGSTSQAHRVYSCEGKSVTLSAGGGGQGGKTGLYATPICHTVPQEVRVRKYTCDIDKFQTLLRESKQKSGLTNKGISVALNKPQTEVEHWFRADKCFSVPDENVWFDLKKLLNIETEEFDDFATVFETREGVFEKSERCYDVDGKMSTLMTGKTDNIIAPSNGKEKTIYEVKNGLITIKGKQYPIKLADGYYIIRKLTVRECMRLQTVPEWYEFPVSNAQAYKMLGNGWTVDVIAHILAYLKGGGE